MTNSGMPQAMGTAAKPAPVMAPAAASSAAASRSEAGPSDAGAQARLAELQGEFTTRLAELKQQQPEADHTDLFRSALGEVSGANEVEFLNGKFEEIQAASNAAVTAARADEVEAAAGRQEAAAAAQLDEAAEPGTVRSGEADAQKP